MRRGHEIALFIFLSGIVFSGMAVNIVRCNEIPGGDLQEKFQSVIGSWINFFEGSIDWLASALIGFMKYLMKAIYFVVGLTGFIMWSTGISRYSGKKLIIGAVIMALVSEILL